MLEAIGVWLSSASVEVLLSALHAAVPFWEGHIAAAHLALGKDRLTGVMSQAENRVDGPQRAARLLFCSVVRFVRNYQGVVCLCDIAAQF